MPVVTPAAKPTRLGVLFYGSTSPAMAEALAMLAAEDIQIDAIRIRAFPFSKAVDAFIEAHDTVFVVEQNESAQLRTLLINEGDYSPKQLVKVLHYDGTPITAGFIAGAIRAAVAKRQAQPLPTQSHG